MMADAPISQNRMNAAAPKRDAPAAVLMTKMLKHSFPAVTSRGPEVGEPHKQIFDNIYYPLKTLTTPDF